MMDDISGWSWVWMSAMMVLFWVGVVALAIWAVALVNATVGDPVDAFGGGTKAGAKPTPIDFAAERYARGEISRDQFEQIRQDLSQGGLVASTQEGLVR